MAAELIPEIRAALTKLQQDWTDQHNARLAAEEALAAERAAHAETRAELETAERTIEANENTLNEFRDGTVCTPAERKVLEACADLIIFKPLARPPAVSGLHAVCEAELARRREKT